MSPGQDVSAGCLQEILSCLTVIAKAVIDLNEHGDTAISAVHFQNMRKECVGLENRNLCGSLSPKNGHSLVSTDLSTN